MAPLILQPDRDRPIEVEHLGRDRLHRTVVVTAPVGLRAFDHEEETVLVVVQDLDGGPRHVREPRRAAWSRKHSVLREQPEETIRRVEVERPEFARVHGRAMGAQEAPHEVHAVRPGLIAEPAPTAPEQNIHSALDQLARDLELHRPPRHVGCERSRRRVCHARGCHETGRPTAIPHLLQHRGYRYGIRVDPDGAVVRAYAGGIGRGACGAVRDPGVGRACVHESQHPELVDREIVRGESRQRPITDSGTIGDVEDDLAWRLGSSRQGKDCKDSEDGQQRSRHLTKHSQGRRERLPR